MPCSTCGRVLAYHIEKQVLYCPVCLDLPAADPEDVKKLASQIREEYLNDEQLMQILQECGSIRVIAQLTKELNEGAAGMVTENNMSFRQFFNALPVLKAVYEHNDKFNHHLESGTGDEQEEIAERVEGILNAGTVLIPVLEQTKEDFAVPIHLSPLPPSSWQDFYANYWFPHSEFWWCSERCLRANVGAREEIREEFIQKEVIFRSFDRPDSQDFDSVREWADHWYGFIVSIGFASALDTTVDEAFTTKFPDSVSIFDLEALLDNVNDAVVDVVASRGRGDFRATGIPTHEFDEVGEGVFGDDWPAVRSSVLVSESNPDAHPLFFELSGTKSRQFSGGRPAREVPVDRVVYPDQFSQLVKFQLFPFLENGELEKSTAVLGPLTAKRGVEFERNVYEYLRDMPATSDVFHSCKTSKQNGNEIDVVFRHDGTTYFVEVKFLLPTLNMQSQDGIEEVNEKFDRKIFKETNDVTGKPFPEKVTSYRGLATDAEISHQVSAADDDRERVQVPREWIDGQYEMLVVSNFVPAYLEKHGVRFLTDLELFQWLDNDEDVFYDVLQPR